MPLPAIGDRVLVTFRGTLCDQRTMSTFLYRITNVTGAPLYNELMDALHSSFSGAGQLITTFRACMPSNWFWTDVWYQIISPTRQRKYAKSMTGAGTASSIATTANLQASITRVGELSGRRYIGGIRMPLGTEDFVVDQGFIQAGQLAALNALCAAMKLFIITSGSVATFRPQVGVPKPPATSLDLEDAFPQATSRVIRRRTVGLGI